MTVGKKVGKLAEKMFVLTGKAAKKLEDYAAKSAVENDNDNARKLAAAMNKFSQSLEEKHDAYIANVEENAEELAELGKSAFDKVKKVCKEMKTRADAAKEKAEADAEKDLTPVEEKGEEKSE